MPVPPGQAKRRTHDYKRHGKRSLFAARGVQSGKVIGRCLPRHRAIEFYCFRDAVYKNVSPDLAVHVIMDNPSTDKTKLVRDWFAKRHRWHVHFTPISASYISPVERFCALLTDEEIRRGAHRSVGELEAAISAYIQTRNADPKSFRWVKSADDVLAAVQCFCLRTVAIQDQCAWKLQNRRTRLGLA